MGDAELRLGRGDHRLRRDAASPEHGFFVGANLDGSGFSGATLTGVNFSGASLRRATGLNQARLNQACGDEATQLPAGLSIRHC